LDERVEHPRRFRWGQAPDRGEEPAHAHAAHPAFSDCTVRVHERPSGSADPGGL